MSVELLEAVTLAELLNSPGARQVLRPPPGEGTEELDQRCGWQPPGLAVRARELAAVLGPRLERARHAAERTLRRSRDLGFEAVVFGDDAYPPRLAQIADPPPVLWFMGDMTPLHRLAVAMVGSRSGSPYGREVAELLAEALSAHGVSVVSGLARGVDAAAHRGALRAGGLTVGVLGCGLDVAYPPEHATLIGRVRAQGAVISEWGPSVPPRTFHFPRRNRIISGLSAAVVVVEAAARSGSLITARLAAEQGREVLAVPGNVLTDRNRGGHALIRDGAKLVETVDDILDELGFAPETGSGQMAGPRDGVESDPVLHCMDTGETYDVDTLASISGVEGPKLSTKLVDLELRGLVVRSEMGRFRRLRG